MNYKDEKGNTFLNIAVKFNCKKEIVQFLLINGCNPNIGNVNNIFFNFLQDEGNCPLHYALSYKNFKIANLLLYYGADESILNKKGLLPWSCINVTLDPEVDVNEKEK